MNIGNLKLDIPVIMAPMAGVTDFPYRQIVREMGCKLLYSEMVSCKGLVNGNSRSYELMEYSAESDGLIAIQLFGEEPLAMAEAAKIVQEEIRPDIIDINMGCPTAKIVKNGSGSALMREPKLAGEIVRKVVEAVEIPVTIKIRAGWDKNQQNAVQIARIGEAAGASAVAVHGRTREQFYTGKADWNIIGLVKESVSIPVIGNGDIFEVEDVQTMMEETNCDAVMIARGCQGNPWLIKRTVYFLESGILLPEPSFKEIIEMALYHLSKAVDYFGEKNAIPRMRKHIAWYIKGLPHSTEIKNTVNRLNNQQEVEQVLIDYLERYKAYFQSRD